MNLEGLEHQAILEKMREGLAHLTPDAELQIKSELVYEILRLKRERNAIILGHNYMEPVLFHTIPDIVGDSLYLAQAAAATERDVIVFCGVRFMAETAKILNPTKTVLLPAQEAGCSLAASITAQDVRDLKNMFPGVPVVVYVNTYADVKAEADFCCTSGNAAAVLDAMESEEVLFLPDEFLARNTAEETGRGCVVVTRNASGELEAQPPVLPRTERGSVIAWHGKCEVHEQFQVEDITLARKQFPDIEVITHPESSPEVVHASDFSGSTTRMVQYVKESSKNHFLILTECSMGDNIIAENPEKKVAQLCNVRCPHMNQITLEDVVHALRNDVTLITVEEEVRQKALRSVERMIAIS